VTTRLGKGQRWVLEELDSGDGCWTRKSRWVLHTCGGTIRTLDALAARGLVTCLDRRAGTERYEITDAGRAINQQPTSAQLDSLLVMMAEEDFEWRDAEGGWWWRSRDFTRTCMELLVRQGLVGKHGKIYGLGHKGLERAKAKGYDPSVIYED
jgi:hypothetical protein